MPHRRALAFLSLLVHALVIGTIVVAQIVAVGTLPTPRSPVTFEILPVVHFANVTPPAQGRQTRATGAGAAPGRASHANAAPLNPPVGIAAETGFEQAAFPSAVAGIEHDGGAGVDALGHGGEGPPAPPPPPKPAPQRLHAGMQPPRKIVDVAPVYPALARTARVTGVVILEAVIDARGRVESVRVLRSIPTLDQAAVDAVRQWRFTPTRLNGEPVPIVMNVTVNFMLSQ